MLSRLLKDIIKCAGLALFISIGISLLFGVLYYLFYNHGNTTLPVFIKNSLYYVGCFGFLISAGFFLQKDANRSFDCQDVWNKMFGKLNLGFVIMFISLFICLYGMIIQLSVESALI